MLAVLDEPAPEGYVLWNGPLPAKALGDVDAQFVWKVMRRHGIALERRRSWCIGAGPGFAAKAADIVGLYLHPPDDAVVLPVDEKPAIQALERAQGWLGFKILGARLSPSHRNDQRRPHETPLVLPPRLKLLLQDERVAFELGS